MKKWTALIIIILIISCTTDKQITPESTKELKVSFTKISELSKMPTRLYGFGDVSDGKDIYVINGASFSIPYVHSNILKYDCDKDKWVSLTSDLIPKSYLNAEFIDGKIYIINGNVLNGQINSKLEVYDILKNKLSYGTANPSPVMHAGSSVWGDKIYIFGGSRNENFYLNRLYSYDTKTDVWTRLSNMPSSIQTKGEIVDGILYTFGGYNGMVSKSIDAYDIEKDSWSHIGNMPVGISANVTVKYGKDIWLVGDYNNLTSLAVFDTKTKEFMPLKSNMWGRRHAGAEIIENKLYIFGGNQQSISNALSNIQVADITGNKDVLNNIISDEDTPSKKLESAEINNEFDTTFKIDFPLFDESVIDDLELLGKIWGFLKYHHPEVGKGKYNWDYELFRILPVYLQSENSSKRDQTLLKWIDKYGIVSKCETCQETSENAFLKPDHYWIEQSDISKELRQKLYHIQQNRHQGEHYYIKTGQNIGNPIFTNENPYSNMPYPDEGFRLLALYRYWNMIHYFFPYKHLIDKDWNNILIEYIPKFIDAKNELEYELTAVQLIGEVQDTHANLWGGNNALNEWKGSNYPPFHLRFIDERLVITDYYNPELEEIVGLQIGDIITKINGKSVESIINEKLPYYPASNNAARLRDMSNDLLRSGRKEIQITYARNEKEVIKNIKLFDKDSLNIYRWYRLDDDKCYKLLENNIGYITLENIKDEDIEIIKHAFKDSKGIIIDIRNYPSTFVPFLLGSYFISDTTAFVKFTKCNVNNPGEFMFTEQLEIPNSSEFYKGKLVVIVNELTQSQAEYTAMAFRAGDNTIIIGSTTAGTDGDVSTIYLPGGLRTMISGIGVYYPDGTETQRIGIVPDIEVKPTIEGIRNGRDELLEYAIDLINSKAN